MALPVGEALQYPPTPSSPFTVSAYMWSFDVKRAEMDEACCEIKDIVIIE